jgi:hypothetical protein
MNSATSADFNSGIYPSQAPATAPTPENVDLSQMSSEQLAERVDTLANRIIDGIRRPPSNSEESMELLQKFTDFRVAKSALDARNRDMANATIQAQAAEIEELRALAEAIHVNAPQVTIQPVNENPARGFPERTAIWARDFFNRVGALMRAHPYLSAAGVALVGTTLTVPVALLYGSEIAIFSRGVWILVARGVNGLLARYPGTITSALTVGLGGGLVTLMILQQDQRRVHED